MTLFADKPDLSDMLDKVDSGDQVRFMVPTCTYLGLSSSIRKSSYMLRTLLFLFHGFSRWLKYKTCTYNFPLDDLFLQEKM